MTKVFTHEVFSERGAGIEVYHYFARSIGLVLSIAVSIIMIFSLYYLFQGLVETVMEGPASFDYAVFQHFFEMVLTALIALEFNHTLTEIVTGRGGLIQVKAVVLIGILVVVRKFILIDIETTAPLFLMGLALAILALGAVYWLVVDIDRKAAGEGGPVEP
ncbi:MAG: hypothetical protein GWN84_22895 [Gammaproteobacteria bacterium]|nr:hypothetical protein [Gammaproteobacteria bacterium]NIR89509.1 hypothetical protein [Gammaproteobacteria bacterium]NIU06594.1 hypothetical protein [Gammaproteobacteria bacterium]NIV53477.1 hypothetical protein [Gammaproteobacteria bacterium]NIV74751.1 hypothetical protein [Gammaproteobacteria bacterium]